MRILKKISTLLFLIVINLNAYSQKSDEYLGKFKNSFIKGVTYPQELIDKCMTTATFLKISVSKTGRASAMVLSNSADPSFDKSFKSSQGRLDVASLNKYLRLSELKNIELLLPIYINFTNNTCATKGTELLQIKRLLEFKGNDFTGKTLIISPIYYNYTIHVDF